MYLLLYVWLMNNFVNMDSIYFMQNKRLQRRRWQQQQQKQEHLGIFTHVFSNEIYRT